MRKAIGTVTISCSLSLFLACSRPQTSEAPRAASAPPASTQRTQQELGWPIWIGIVCEDLEAQRHFYRDLLGLRERIVSAESVWYEFDGKLLELFPKSERPQYARGGVAFGFVVSDIRSARDRLIQRGVHPVGNVEGGPDQYWAYFKDADGNLFELVQPVLRKRPFGIAQEEVGN